VIHTSSLWNTISKGDIIKQFSVTFHSEELKIVEFMNIGLS